MENNIKGKKILFVSYNFYNYNIEIRDKLVQLGAEVDMYEQIKYTLWFTILLRFRLSNWYKKKLSTPIIEAAKTKKYDYVLVLEIHQTDEFYRHLRELQPDAKFVLYYWDSVKFFDYRPYMKYFDNILSFDIDDARQYDNIKYLPLFFIDAYAKVKNNPQKDFKYDMLQVASFSEERYSKVMRFFKENNINRDRTYIYYRTTLGKYILLLFRGGYDMKMIGIRKMSQDEIICLYHQTRSVLDFSKQQQSGLTMRTIESMGAGKKLITSNSYLKDEPIYNPNNILIIEENKKSDINSFLNQEFVYTDEIEQYSIQNWCLNLFLS